MSFRSEACKDLTRIENEIKLSLANKILMNFNPIYNINNHFLHLIPR